MAKDVSKSFGATTALQSLSLKVRPGEVLGLLVPNGTSKTTTIHLLVGFLQPDSRPRTSKETPVWSQ